MSLDELTREYNQKLPLYNSFRERLHSAVRDRTQGDPNIFALHSRVKTLPSLAAKAERMNEPSSLSDFNDLVGVRVVVNNDQDVFKVVERIVRDLNAVKSSDDRWADDFRYRRVRLTVSIDGEIAKLPEWSSFSGLRAEIQIKTAFAEALDNAEHLTLFNASAPSYRVDRSKAIPADTKTFIARSDTDQLSAVITHFEQVLDHPSVHEKRDIHPFLNKNRFILHPNPERIWSEVPIGLGTEHRMDFLIQEADGEFLLIELENPRHRLFLKSGDFSAPLNHAQRQIEDWQDWVEDNISTMQKTYPGIISPRGLVIIGRSRSLSESDRRKLRRRNINLRGKVKIITYDELIAGARTYVDSIRHQLQP